MKKSLFLLLTIFCLASLSACQFKLIPDKESESSDLETREEAQSYEEEITEEILPPTPVPEPKYEVTPDKEKTTGKIFAPSSDDVRPEGATPPKDISLKGEAQFSSQVFFQVRNTRK
jgi:hypothetical protein